MSVAVCTWTSFPNMNVKLGVPRRDTTVPDCQLACINTMYCNGIDIDLNPGATYCWLTVLPKASGPIQQYSGVTHYTLFRNVGCPYRGEFVDLSLCTLQD